MIRHARLHRWLSGLLVLVFALTPMLAAADWTPLPTNTGWLAAVNAYRAHAGLAAITEDAQMTADCKKHVNYIIQTATLTHSEVQGSQWYTPEGDLAARQSNLNGGATDTPGTELASVDGWINTVYHGIPMLSPRLLKSGFWQDFGMSATAGVNWTGGCINTQRGDSGQDPAAPVYWPPKDKTAPFLDYHGGEIPNPLCGGYTIPTGPFITLQVPDLLQNAQSSTGSIKLGNQTLESCIYDTTNVTMRPGDEQWLTTAKGILNKYNAVVLVPKLPLTPGNTYDVAMTVNGKDYAWSFDTGPAPKQTVTVTATSVGRNINVPNPPLGYTISGQIPGDTEDTIFTTKPTCTTAAQTNSPAGQYDIVCSGGVSTNYTIAYVKGTLTVTDPAAAFTLTTSAVGTGTVSPAGTTQQAGVVNVTATAGTGQLFTGWKVNGTPKGWANPLQVTMTGNMTVEATFVAKPTFQDVKDTDGFANAVQQLAARGIIKGCDQVAVPPFFCPTGDEGKTKRAQMAALIARAMGWSAAAGNPFTDQCDPRGAYDPAKNCIDPELWNAVGTLGSKNVPLPGGTPGGPVNVAKGYTDAGTCGSASAVPCYAPRDYVLKVQVIIFIGRAMIAQGYWTLATDDTSIFPNRNGATDAEKLDHRVLVTYVQNAGAPPDVANANANWDDFAAPSTREWFARALWQALNSYFGVNR